MGFNVSRALFPMLTLSHGASQAKGKMLRAARMGVVFVVTAFAAGQMDPKAGDDFIVPLRQEPPDFGEDD